MERFVHAMRNSEKQDESEDTQQKHLQGIYADGTIWKGKKEKQASTRSAAFIFFSPPNLTRPSLKMYLTIPYRASNEKACFPPRRRLLALLWGPETQCDVVRASV